ncbi:MAG: methylamine utilization protein MauG [Proteobacteria bacterium]|nr:methylamine utilization protein MauG [Pseudomonadota bacterium]
MTRVRSGRMHLCVAAFASVASLFALRSAEAEPLRTSADLGRALFGDRNLSLSRKKNCISCHSPELAFTDPRALGDVQGAVSRGGDGHSLGDRNSPTLGYAMMTPPFHIAAEEGAVGGMFWDGRARTMADQVRDPLLNPIEMGMPDEESVVARLRENADYRAAFPAIFGAGVLADTPKAFGALQKAVAAYLHTADFAPFDSKYDRSLRGEVALSQNEARGRDLFFGTEGAGCSRCHSSAGIAGLRDNAFTNFRYFNLGVPKNTAVRRLNGSDTQRVDNGLGQNPAANNASFDGAFKVPTLRNVAVTAPYMHNGAFQELRTAILFHLRFSDLSGAKINPETGASWRSPEVDVNVATADLEFPRLSGSDVDAIIAFLNTLTDKRYEPLLAN